jgi:hypothetical protein
VPSGPGGESCPEAFKAPVPGTFLTNGTDTTGFAGAERVSGSGSGVAVSFPVGQPLGRICTGTFGARPTSYT